MTDPPLPAALQPDYFASLFGTKVLMSMFQAGPLPIVTPLFQRTTVDSSLFAFASGSCFLPGLPPALLIVNFRLDGTSNGFGCVIYANEAQTHKTLIPQLRNISDLIPIPDLNVHSFTIEQTIGATDANDFFCFAVIEVPPAI